MGKSDGRPMKTVSEKRGARGGYSLAGLLRLLAAVWEAECPLDLRFAPEEKIFGKNRNGGQKRVDNIREGVNLNRRRTGNRRWTTSTKR